MRARSPAASTDGLIPEVPTLKMTITAISVIIKSIVKTKYAINTPVFFHEQAPRTRIVVMYAPRIKYVTKAVVAPATFDDCVAVIIPATIRIIPLNPKIAIENHKEDKNATCTHHI
mgnify:CR=1 FL=1